MFRKVSTRGLVITVLCLIAGGLLVRASFANAAYEQSVEQVSHHYTIECIQNYRQSMCTRVIQQYQEACLEKADDSPFERFVSGRLDDQAYMWCLKGKERIVARTYKPHGSTDRDRGSSPQQRVNQILRDNRQQFINAGVKPPQ